MVDLLSPSLSNLDFLVALGGRRYKRPHQDDLRFFCHRLNPCLASPFQGFRLFQDLFLRHRHLRSRSQ